MTPAECLKEFVNERLSAAAEEIFGIFKRTIEEYEKEIDRQRRLLDSEPPQQHVCQKEQQLSNQEENFSPGQEDLDDPKTEEEHLEICPSWKDEHIEVKLETDRSTKTSSNEDENQSKEENLCLINTSSESGAGVESFCSFSVQTVVSEPGRHGDVEYDLQLSSQCSEVNLPEKSETIKYEEIKQNDQHLTSNSKNNKKSLSELRRPLSVQKAKMSALCPTFQSKKCVNKRMSSHFGEKPCLCKTCGKRFTSTSTLNRHLKKHTGERPHLCETCGKGFPDMYRLKAHLIIHTPEKPYTCQACKKEFKYNRSLEIHRRVAHTGEKPYECKTCGGRFSELQRMKRHMRIHED